MEENYFDPDRFRMSLNSFIQEARNVTFILQKNKKELPRFEEWYAGWQEKLKADKILRSIVDSRNRITKQGDPEIKSQCFIVFTADWTDELTRRFRGNPLVPTPVLARQILVQLPKELISDESLICIERKWIDSSLPDTELLQATGHALRVLSELVHDAHNSLVAPNYPDFKCPHSAKLADAKQNYSFELANAEELRKVWMRADNLEMTQYSLQANVLETKGFEAEKIRYGEILPELKQIGAPNDLESAIKHYKLVSKQILIKDGFHLSMVFAMSLDGKGFYNIGLKMDDRAGKHIAIRRVASLLAQDSIKWVVMVGEVWVAENRVGEPFKHASEFPDRKEALVVQGVSCDGLTMNSQAIFKKINCKTVVDDWVDDSDMANIMLPIFNVIRTPVKQDGKVSEK